MTIALIAVDRHPVLRMGLARAVAGCPDIALVAAAGTVAEAVRLTGRYHPTVVTLGGRMADGDAVSAATRLRAVAPDLGLVLLAGEDDDDLVPGALAAGVCAVVRKVEPAARAVVAIRGAAADPHAVTQRRLAALLQAPPAGPGPLSRRESEVLVLLGDGAPVAAIAGRLRLSESTVKTYVARIYAKLGVRNRSQALVAAQGRGLLADPVRAA